MVSIAAFQADDPSSIPGRCKYFCRIKISTLFKIVIFRFRKSRTCFFHDKVYIREKEFFEKVSKLHEFFLAHEVRAFWRTTFINKIF